MMPPATFIHVDRFDECHATFAKQSATLSGRHNIRISPHDVSSQLYNTPNSL